MSTKEIKRVSELLIKIGQRISDDASFLSKLESFVAINENIDKKETIDSDKINSIDLFQLVREQSEENLSTVLSELKLAELKALLKKYRFGSPSRFKTSDQIKNYILNQLRQRKTDVFQPPQSEYKQDEI